LTFYIIRRKKMADAVEDWEHDIGPHRFPYEELKKATWGFKEKELIGSGGFGRVYKGILPNSDTQVAVKRIPQDSEFNARLSDFGLAKLYEHGSNPSTTRVVGTLGYMAPELTRTSKPTTSSDVYAFGALLLEVVCGRRPINPTASSEELMLVDWVWEKWAVGEVLDVVDPRMVGNFDEAEAVLVLKLGLICSNDDADVRPSMRLVVRYLEGELALQEEVAMPYKKKGGGRGGPRGSEPRGSHWTKRATRTWPPSRPAPGFGCLPSPSP
jgi:hypothetical protein